MHCGSTEHDLVMCPHISDQQLAEILIQMQDTEFKDDGVVDGAMLYQRQGIGSAKDPCLSGGIKSSRLYLDTCTTNNQCINGAYLTGIHTVKTQLTMHTNAGSSTSNKKGHLGRMLFWLNPGGLASIVSL